MIFLNEDFASDFSSTGTPSTLRQLNEEFNLNEADFSHFARLDAGYEIMYEAECAFNQIQMAVMNEEFKIMLEEEEGSQGFWARVAATLEKWWNWFKGVLAKVWNAIKAFFTKIKNFFFGNKKTEEKVKEKKKVLDLAKPNAKFKFYEVDFDAIKQYHDSFKRLIMNIAKYDGKEELLDKKDSQDFIKTYKEELKEQTKKFKDVFADKEKKMKTGSASEARKALDESMKAISFVTALESMSNDALKDSSKYADEVKKDKDKLKNKKTSKEDKEKIKNGLNYKVMMATFHKDIAKGVVEATGLIVKAVQKNINQTAEITAGEMD